MSLPYAYTPDILPLLSAAAMLLVLAVFAWRHRTVASATPFAIIQSLLLVANLANALELAAVEFPLKVFWRQIWFASLLPQGPLWLATAIKYAGIKSITRRGWMLLSLIPSIAFLLLFTNDAHHLIWAAVWQDGQLQVSRGVWNWLVIAYSYVLEVVSLSVFASVLVRSRGVYRWQAAILGFAGTTSWLGMGLRFLGIDLIPGLDEWTVGSFISSPIFAIGLFRFRALDLAPVVRDTVIEHMGVAMIVLDMQNRVVDVNLAAQRLLGVRIQSVGQDALQALSGTPDLMGLASGRWASDPQLVLEINGKWYDARALSLTDAHGAALGRLILLNDITELHLAQARLLEQQRAIAGLEERERLARDLHDGAGQVLAYASVQAEAARKLICDGQTEVAAVQLARLASVVRDAHADVREHILNLRVAPSAQQPFLAVLQRYLDSYAQNYAIRARLAIGAGLDDRAFEPEVQMQLLRIIQEALSNARTHAYARSVQVAFESAPGLTRLCIQDDGRGFDPASPPSGDGSRFGLQFMRERAEQLGGCFKIDSGPGQGTRIIVEIPVTDRGQRKGND